MTSVPSIATPRANLRAQLERSPKYEAALTGRAVATELAIDLTLYASELKDAADPTLSPSFRARADSTAEGYLATIRARIKRLGEIAAGLGGTK